MYVALRIPNGNGKSAANCDLEETEENYPLNVKKKHAQFHTICTQVAFEQEVE